MKSKAYSVQLLSPGSSSGNAAGNSKQWFPSAIRATPAETRVRFGGLQ